METPLQANISLLALLLVDRHRPPVILFQLPHDLPVYALLCMWRSNWLSMALIGCTCLSLLGSTTLFLGLVRSNIASLIDNCPWMFPFNHISSIFSLLYKFSFIVQLCQQFSHYSQQHPTYNTGWVFVFSPLTPPTTTSYHILFSTISYLIVFLLCVFFVNVASVVSPFFFFHVVTGPYGRIGF